MSITYTCHKVYIAHIQRRPKVGKKQLPANFFTPKFRVTYWVTYSCPVGHFFASRSVGQCPTGRENEMADSSRRQNLSPQLEALIYIN